MKTSRRLFLTGTAGLTLGLPLLEGLNGEARAAEGDPFLFFVRQGNGVSQADEGEPEGFWPRNEGELSQEVLEQDSDRVLSELSPYGRSITAIKGLSYAFSSNGCGHSGGGNQCLTANEVSDDPSGQASLAMGESVDNFVARSFSENGGEPLTLYTGPRGGYLEEVLSYRGSKDIRPAEDDPWTAYQRMLGVDEGVDLEGLDLRRQSINDVLSEQLDSLIASPQLSSADVARLTLHRESIRDFERLSCRVSEEQALAMQDGVGLSTLDDRRMLVARQHLDLMALAAACGFVRSGTLQIGDGNDGTEYTIDGQRLPNFHWISHRIYSDGDEGETIVGAYDMHQAIDRLYAQTFMHLLDRLNEHGILDQGISVWCNDLGAGVSHSYNNVPFVLAGSAGGALRAGQFLDLGGVYHNKLMNTLISAVGVRTESGGLVEDFGHSSLDGGVLDGLLS